MFFMKTILLLITIFSFILVNPAKANSYEETFEKATADISQALDNMNKALADMDKATADLKKALEKALTNADMSKTFCYSWLDCPPFLADADMDKAIADKDKAEADFNKAYADYKKALADKDKANAD